MERGLLSSKELASSYDDVVWLYLFQDFSGSEEDRAAQRVAIRFGITSWPRHFLVDARNLGELGSTGRTLESFRAAVRRAKPGRGEVAPSANDLATADALAARLERTGSAALARKHLRHGDVVVRFRATEIFAEKDPKRLVKESGALLGSHHDPTRFLVCKVLAQHGDERAAPSLEAILREPGESKNPNVVRMRAVAALGRCGTPRSLDVISPHASSGAYFNGLTGASLDAVVAIVERHPKASPAARKLLKQAYPAPSASGAPAREQRACVALARRVHTALRTITGKDVRFPKSYDAASRARLVKSW